MSERIDFERIVAGHIAGEGVAPPDDAFYDELLLRADRAGQRPRWLALIKEPPMRTSSHLAVGSPMVRVAAVTVATLLLALVTLGAGIAGQRLFAAGGPIIVAQDGSGHYATITEAVAVAEDGDSVLVRPGTYVEAIVIERDITLRGDGSGEQIVVQAPEDGPTATVGDLPNPRPEAAYAVLLRDSDATVSGLTFRGEPSRLHVQGGSPALEGLVFDGVGRPFGVTGELYGSIAVSDGSMVTVRGSTFEGGNGIRVFDDSAPYVEGNTLRAGATIFGYLGDDSVIRGNDVSGPSPGGGIGIMRPSAAVIEDNVVADAANGIWVGSSLTGEDGGPIIRRNSITGGASAIEVGRGAAPTIEDNTVSGNRTGILLSKAGPATVTGNTVTDNTIGIGIHESTARVEGNEIRGGTTGVVVNGDATPELAGNTIEGATYIGLRVGRGAHPILTDNRICDNAANLVLDDGANPVMEENEICADPPKTEAG